MTIDFSLHENDLLIAGAILIPSFFYSFFWFLFDSDKLMHNFYTKYAGDKATIHHILFLKYAGFVLLGVIPAILFLILFPQYSLKDLGVRFTDWNVLHSFYWILSIGGTMIILNRITIKRDRIFNSFPQIRAKVWDRKLIFSYSMAWAIYILGYEFLFRGILLMPLVNTIGTWPAITINVALYAIVHAPQGKDGVIGSAVLGIPLCLMTLMTGNIWATVLTHICFAWSNSLFALKFHPEFRIVKSKRTKLEE